MKTDAETTHTMFEINRDAQSSHRNPLTFWSFKEEECMGKLGVIGAAVHATNVATRSLERWCAQLFNVMGTESQPCVRFIDSPGTRTEL